MAKKFLEFLEKSYVVIETTDFMGRKGGCVGFCVCPNVILTASHCIEHRTPYIITPDEKANVEAKEIFSIVQSDLSFLATPVPLEPVKLADPLWMMEVMMPYRFENYRSICTTGRIVFLDDQNKRFLIENKVMFGSSGAPIVDVETLNVVGMFYGSVGFPYPPEGMRSDQLGAAISSEKIKEAMWAFRAFAEAVKIKKAMKEKKDETEKSDRDTP